MSLPFFHFTAADWIASPTVMLMTCEERGQYIQLLALAWLDTHCGLPDDESILGRLAGCTGPISPTVKKCFLKHPKEAGKVTNPRLYEEWLFAESKRKKNRRAARERWDKKKDAKQPESYPPETDEKEPENDAPECDGNANALHSQCERNPMERRGEDKNIKTLSDTSDAIVKDPLDIPGESGYSPRFQLFWESYPARWKKSASKREAWEEWVKIKNMPEAIHGIRAGFDRMMACLDEHPDTFLKHPCRWLRKRQWKDEWGQPTKAAEEQSEAERMKHLDDLFKEHGKDDDDRSSAN